MNHLPARRAASARAALSLALLTCALAVAACGTKGDDTLGVSLIEDRGARKAVRFVSMTADTGVSFQSGTQAGDPATATTLLASARPGYSARALMRFPSSVLPGGGATLDSATVIFPFRDGFGTGAFALEVHRVTESWTESTFPPDSFPAYDPVASVTVAVPYLTTALDTFSLSLTALAQAWSDDTTTNFGIALVAAGTEAGELGFDARESTTPPRLTVHWTSSGADSSRNSVPDADTYTLGTTPAFVPLADSPGRLTVARGFAGRSFLYFPWVDPGARSTIHRAELTLHADASLSSTNGFALAVRRVITRPWSGFDTEVDPTLRGIQTATADQDSVVLDVTAVLIEMLDARNEGIEIRPADERPDTDYFRFHGFDSESPALAPTLRVWWTPGDLPEDAP